MRLIKRSIAFCLFLAVCAGIYTLSADKQRLRDDIIRLHVVGASDTAQDQQIKLQVRDAVLQAVQHGMESLPDARDAKVFLQSSLQRIEAEANRALERAGVKDRATVSLQREYFDTRAYDTFTLPAGVYESLRVTIGAGEGKNWWCVVFPALCTGATVEETEDIAAGAGFSDSLSGAMGGEPQYRIRFFLLDLWGKLEKFFGK